MASSLKFNTIAGAVLTAGIIASGSGVISRILYHPTIPEEPAYLIAVEEGEGEGAPAEEEAQPLPVLLASAEAGAGESEAKVCTSCHSFEEGGADMVGPHLWGVVGREIASAEGFSYSEALAGMEGDWTYEHLDAFIANPSEWAPGTKMSFAGVSDPEDRADLLVYLQSLAEDPVPLPEPEEAPAAEEGEATAEGEQQPAEGEQAAPAEGEQAAPAEGEQQAAEGEQAAPAEGEQAAPPEGEQQQAAEGEQQQAAAEGEEQQAAEGEQAAPAEGEQQAAEGEQAAPAEGEQQAAEGEQQPAADQQMTAGETAPVEAASDTETASAPADQPAASASEGAAAGEQAAEGAGGDETQSAAVSEEQQPEAPDQAATADQGGAQDDGTQDGGAATGFVAMVASADPSAGEMFSKRCSACHTFDEGGANRVGPNLHGVVGRDIATVEGFNYSDALQGLEGDWTVDKLDAYLTDPRGYAPGNRMAYAGVKDEQDRANLIAYLRSISPDAPSLPGG